jgi:hypothetical protein
MTDRRHEQPTPARTAARQGAAEETDGRAARPRPSAAEEPPRRAMRAIDCSADPGDGGRRDPRRW